MSRDAVLNEFEEFLQNKRLRSNQIRFIKQMIEFYTQNGHLDVANLYEPPFSFINKDGIDGAFNDKTNIIDLLIGKVGKLNAVRAGGT